MREEFEKLPAIKRAMKDGSVEWDDGDDCYGGDDDYCSGYVNGARYAYQEQQKKIDALKNLIDEIVGIVREADLSDGDSSVAIVHDEIQELLK